MSVRSFDYQISEVILGDVAKVLDLGLNAPIPFVLLQEFMLVKEAVQYQYRRAGFLYA